MTVLNHSKTLSWWYNSQLAFHISLKYHTNIQEIAEYLLNCRNKNILHDQIILKVTKNITIILNINIYCYRYKPLTNVKNEVVYKTCSAHTNDESYKVLRYEFIVIFIHYFFIVQIRSDLLGLSE